MTLRYKPEGRGFDSRWCHRNFFLTSSFRPPYGLGVDSASNTNEYQGYLLGGKGGWCIELTALPLSCAECLEILEPHPPGTLRAYPGLHRFALPFSIIVRKDGSGRSSCVVPDDVHLPPQSRCSVSSKSMVEAFVLRECRVSVPSSRIKQFVVYEGKTSNAQGILGGGGTFT